jgi:hypothetical protein
MSSKYSTVKRLPNEKPSKKRTSALTLREFLYRWWCFARRDYGYMAGYEVYGTLGDKRCIIPGTYHHKAKNRGI